MRSEQSHSGDSRSIHFDESSERIYQPTYLAEDLSRSVPGNTQ